MLMKSSCKAFWDTIPPPDISTLSAIEHRNYNGMWKAINILIALFFTEYRLQNAVFEYVFVFVVQKFK